MTSPLLPFFVLLSPSVDFLKLCSSRIVRVEYKNILAHIRSLLEFDHIFSRKQELGNVYKAIRGDLKNCRLVRLVIELVLTWKGGDKGRSSRPFLNCTFMPRPPLCGQYDRATDVLCPSVVQSFCTDSCCKSAIE